MFRLLCLNIARTLAPTERSVMVAIGSSLSDRVFSLAHLTDIHSWPHQRSKDTDIHHRLTVFHFFVVKHLFYMFCPWSFLSGHIVRIWWYYIDYYWCFMVFAFHYISGWPQTFIVAQTKMKICSLYTGLGGVEWLLGVFFKSMGKESNFKWLAQQKYPLSTRKFCKNNLYWKK